MENPWNAKVRHESFSSFGDVLAGAGSNLYDQLPDRRSLSNSYTNRNCLNLQHWRVKDLSATHLTPEL